MPIGPLAEREKKRVVSKVSQLTGLGILAPTRDQKGEKVLIQPTIVSRPNALASLAYNQGMLGNQIPSSVLTDMAINSNQASTNQTRSGIPNSINGFNFQRKKTPLKNNLGGY